MSRSGYYDDCDDYWATIRWRGAVRSALRGRRGQAFLRQMLAAMDALPQPRLIVGELVNEAGECCAIGSVALSRGVDVSELDPEEHEHVASVFGIARAMTQEIAYMNDEVGSCKETPEQRFARMRHWIESELGADRG